MLPARDLHLMEAWLAMFADLFVRAFSSPDCERSLAARPRVNFRFEILRGRPNLCAFGMLRDSLMNPRPLVSAKSNES